MSETDHRQVMLSWLSIRRFLDEQVIEQGCILLRSMSLLLAQMRSADRVRKCLMLGVDRT
jgi:hypothetical protein